MSATPIADELEARMWLIADPKTKWVPHPPRGPQVCLVTSGAGRYLSNRTWDYLNEFIHDLEGVNATRWNDQPGRTRQQVIWLLETAVDQARWEEV